jgi:hypothetical protein
MDEINEIVSDQVDYTDELKKYIDNMNKIGGTSSLGAIVMGIDYNVKSGGAEIMEEDLEQEEIEKEQVKKVLTPNLEKKSIEGGGDSILSSIEDKIDDSDPLSGIHTGYLSQ